MLRPSASRTYVNALAAASTLPALDVTNGNARPRPSRTGVRICRRRVTGSARQRSRPDTCTGSGLLGQAGAEQPVGPEHHDDDEDREDDDVGPLHAEDLPAQ